MNSTADTQKIENQPTDSRLSLALRHGIIVGLLFVVGLVGWWDFVSWPTPRVDEKAYLAAVHMLEQGRSLTKLRCMSTTLRLLTS